jgi:hypothetical protein
VTGDDDVRDVSFVLRADPGEVAASGPIGVPHDDAAFAELVREFAGMSFNHGLYRVVGPASSTLARALIAVGFPSFAPRAIPVGYDWRGRVFATDVRRRVDGERGILMFETGTGRPSRSHASWSGFTNAS